MSEYENMRTADILAEALLDWKVNVIFGLPGDGINGFIEALRQRRDKIKFVLVRHEESAAFMVENPIINMSFVQIKLVDQSFLTTSCPYEWK
jgi:glyoxylate carboligase